MQNVTQANRKFSKFCKSFNHKNSSKRTPVTEPEIAPSLSLDVCKILMLNCTSSFLQKETVHCKEHTGEVNKIPGFQTKSSNIYHRKPILQIIRKIFCSRNLIIRKIFCSRIIFLSFTSIVLFFLRPLPCSVIIREIKNLKGAQGNKGVKSKAKSEKKEKEQGLQLS